MSDARKKAIQAVALAASPENIELSMTITRSFVAQLLGCAVDGWERAIAREKLLTQIVEKMYDKEGHSFECCCDGSYIHPACGLFPEIHAELNKSRDREEG